MPDGTPTGQGPRSSTKERNEVMRPATILFTAMGAAVLPHIMRGAAFGVAEASRPLEHQHEEDRGLVAAGFEPVEGTNLWKREGVFFGREAASQGAWRKPYEHRGWKSFEEV